MAHVASIANRIERPGNPSANAIATPVWRQQSLRHVRCGDNAVLRLPQHVSGVEINTNAHPAPATPIDPYGNPEAQARTGIGAATFLLMV